TLGGTNVTSRCLDARAGIGNQLENDQFFSDNVRLASTPGVQNSSSASLVLNPGATVVWAGLYWSGDLHAGDEVSRPGNPNYIPPGAPPVDPARRGFIGFLTPASGGVLEV